MTMSRPHSSILVPLRSSLSEERQWILFFYYKAPKIIMEGWFHMILPSAVGMYRRIMAYFK